MAAEIPDLMWRGAETVAAAKSALARAAAVKLQLLAGYRHAVHARLGAPARADAAEALDVAGAAELLGAHRGYPRARGHRRARVAGGAGRARMRGVSPSPAIAIVCERAAERGA